MRHHFFSSISTAPVADYILIRDKRVLEFSLTLQGPFVIISFISNVSSGSFYSVAYIYIFYLATYPRATYSGWLVEDSRRIIDLLEIFFVRTSRLCEACWLISDCKLF